jgi:nucleoside-diphosphate-sugar epimerase
MSTILVTGGSGRLGRSVVEGLAGAGHRVISVDRDAVPAAQLAAGAEQHTADLLAPGEALRLFQETAPDAVIHLAAIAVPFSAPEEVIFATNTRLAYAVLSAATEVGVPKIITASSPTVLGYGSPAGRLPDAFPLDEQSTPRPWNAYALSKLIAEQTMQMFAAAQGDRLRYAAFRPCFVISPEEWQGAPTQQGHTLAERLADPALAAPALFNYVDARDVADFLDLLLQKMDSIPNGQTFFVGAADALATEPLAELIPRFLPGSAGLAAHLTGTSPAFSIVKAKELLGWEPKRNWRNELRIPGDSPEPSTAEASTAEAITPEPGMPGLNDPTPSRLNDEAPAALATAGTGSKETS